MQVSKATSKESSLESNAGVTPHNVNLNEDGSRLLQGREANPLLYTFFSSSEAKKTLLSALTEAKGQTPDLAASKQALTPGALSREERNTEERSFKNAGRDRREGDVYDVAADERFEVPLIRRPLDGRAESLRGVQRNAKKENSLHTRDGVAIIETDFPETPPLSNPLRRFIPSFNRGSAPNFNLEASSLNTSFFEIPTASQGSLSFALTPVTRAPSSSGSGVGGSSANGPAKNPEAERASAEGEAKLKSKDFSVARDNFKRAVSLDPQNGAYSQNVSKVDALEHAHLKKERREVKAFAA